MPEKESDVAIRAIAIRLTPRLIFGLAILAIGTILLLESLGVANADALWDYWPLFLVAIGVVKLNEARRTSAWISASLWVFVGAWWTLYNVGIVDLHILDLWPILLIVGGLSLMRRSWRPGRPRSESPVDADHSSGFAVFCGVRRQISSKNFENGDFSAIMGGCEVDMTQADISSGEATIDVVAIMGGIDIRVPRTWTIDDHVTAILGGFADRTDRSQADPNKRLVVRGTAMMGGVDIKN